MLKKLAGKSGKQVINLARSGSKIVDVSKDMESFIAGKHDYFKNDSAMKMEDIKVTNIILSIGTNDILRLRDPTSVNSLFVPIQSMLKKAKHLYNCKVVLQGVIPIPGQPNYIRHATLQFNRMAHQICRQQKCYFLDLWDDFLDCRHFSKFYIRRRDGYCDIHPNQAGLSILARAYIGIIRNYFDPLIRS